MTNYAHTTDTALTDEQLMARLQLGDQWAYDELYARHSGLLIGFIISTLRRALKRYTTRYLRGPAEDISQDAWGIVHSKASQFDPNKGSFKNWLYVIAERKSLNYRRSNRPEQLSEVLFAEPSTGRAVDTVASTEAESTIQAAIDSLPDDERGVIRSVYFERRTLVQYAQTLGRNKSYASRLHERALRKLRSRLTDAAYSMMA